MNTPTTPLARWRHFWFAPADPTTLGFMRIVTGVLILYIHLTYSFDLTAFFGRHGWHNLEEMNAERREFPQLLPKLDAWEDEWVTPAYMPDYPHRRTAVMEYYRTLSEMPPAERAAALAYFVRLQQSANVRVVAAALEYLKDLPADPTPRAARLEAMVKPELRTLIDVIPPAFDQLPQTGPDSRTTLKAELIAAFAALSTDPEKRKYVINHLTEITIAQRSAILMFLLNLPTDPAARAEQLAYVEKWNVERSSAYRTGMAVFSIWFHISDPTSMAVTHGVVLVIMLLFTLGLFTRVTSVLTWLAAISYIHRTSEILFGMDTMMNILLIYLMIGPSGAALSLDRRRACRKADRLSRARNNGQLDAATTAFLAKPPAMVSAGFVLRLVQVHFCFIYMAAGMSKLQGRTWWSTAAWWETMGNPEFTLLHYNWYENAMRQIVGVRWLANLIASGTIAFTFLCELGVPFLLWTRLRPLAVILGLFLHFGIGVTMGLNLFGLLMMTMLLAYLPGRMIREQLR